MRSAHMHARVRCVCTYARTCICTRQVDELPAAIRQVALRPLPPDRPLWRVIALQRADGTSALLLRVHHCIGDGAFLASALLPLLGVAPATPPPTAARHSRLADGISGGGEGEGAGEGDRRVDLSPPRVDLSPPPSPEAPPTTAAAPAGMLHSALGVAQLVWHQPRAWWLQLVALMSAEMIGVDDCALTRKPTLASLPELPP